MTVGLRALIPIFFLGAALVCSPFALADTYYTAVIDGPTAGTVSPATGTALLTLNSAETEVAYVIEFAALAGSETVAHIHNAPPGILGPVFHPLEQGSPKTGVWEVGTFEVAELNAGRVNILIHSDIYLAGEIRGNVEYSSASGVDGGAGGIIPADLMLGSNFPNPFNPLTTINYGIPHAERVKLAIFDVRGRLVADLLDEVQPAGYHQVVWDGKDDSGRMSSAGMYLYRLEVGNFVEARRMTLVK